MKQATVSFVKGKGNVNHNNRKFITSNVDRSKIEDNMIYVQKDLKKFYKEIFQEAVDEYNANQTRSDRKIESYYDKIFKSKQEKLFYEVVVQVGDKDFTDKDGASRVLNDYMLDFERRNPNLKVFNAVMHVDEQTPHLHIDFVPVAEGYKRGLTRRNSLSKALGGQMVDWYKKEREYIKTLAEFRGIEIVEKNEPKRSYIPIIEFKALKESSKYVIDAFKENIKEIDELNKKFNSYHNNAKRIPELIENTIYNHSIYKKEMLGGGGYYKIPEEHMYELKETLIRQYMSDDFKVFRDGAERLLKSVDFDENKLMQNLVENKELFKRLNDVELENKRLKEIEKEFKEFKKQQDKKDYEHYCEKEKLEQIIENRDEFISNVEEYINYIDKVDECNNFLEQKRKLEKERNKRLNHSNDRGGYSL